MTRDESLKTLMYSKKTGRVIGIQLKKKTKILVTAVDEVGDCMILVKPSTFYGQLITNRNILLDEIESVRIFDSKFEDPMFVRLRNLKHSIRKIRSALS